MQKIKNHIKVFLLIFVLFFSGACNKWLDLEPENALVMEEFWNSKEDIEAVLAAMYDSFREGSLDSYLWGEIRADMIEWGGLTSTWSDYSRIAKSDISASNDKVKWDQYYDAINLANTVLQFGPTVMENDRTLTREIMNGYESEALFIRSLCYFYLVRVWKDVPYVSQATSSDTVDIYLPKSEENVVLSHVIEDLKVAESLAFETLYRDKPELFRGRANKFSIQSLMADIYLWMSNYNGCIEYCDKVMNTGIYTLNSGETWLWYELYFPGNSDESIFEIQFDDKLEGQENDLHKDLLLRMRPGEISTEYFTFQDIRKCSFYGFLWKYKGVNYNGMARSSSERDANFIYYRYADLLLMKAEALGELGKRDQGTALMNEVIERAGLVGISVPSTIEDYRSILLEERAREFAGEGKRWFDLLRFAKRNQFAQKQLIMSVLLDGASITELPTLRARVLDTMGYYFPIHEDELNYNPNLIQNPYYIK